MAPVAEITWSTEVGEAAWIRERLTPTGATSVVPSGFEAYARVLHPARMVDGEDERFVRWSEVASWSGLRVAPNARFHSVALPPVAPHHALPLCLPPNRGSLTFADVSTLIDFLSGRSASDECLMCIWEGYSWQGLPTDPVPAELLDGPLVDHPRRRYVLFTGPLAAATGFRSGPESEPQTPNLWWPADRSWCVASDIDIPWSYVGGPAALIDELLRAPGLETLPAAASDPVLRVEGWVQRWAMGGADELLRHGDCRIETPKGVVTAWLERPSLVPGALGVTSETADGRRNGRQTTLEHRSEADLHRSLLLHLAMHLVDLVEG